MPENFYDRVLNYERKIETKKEKCPHSLITSLTNLYQAAIDYHFYMHEYD
jgi:hypothetical protein